MRRLISAPKLKTQNKLILKPSPIQNSSPLESEPVFPVPMMSPNGPQRMRPPMPEEASNNAQQQQPADAPIGAGTQHHHDAETLGSAVDDLHADADLIFDDQPDVGFDPQ